MTTRPTPMQRMRPLFLAAALAAACPAAAADDIDRLPATVTFAISTGYWEDSGDAVSEANPATAGAKTPADPQAATRRGYYKLVSIRQADRTAKVYLQQVAALDAGPQVVSSVEIEQLTAMRPYVTDIRPENSSGGTVQPGMFATVYLKTEAEAREVESWTVMIDDLGEMIVERATN